MNFIWAWDSVFKKFFNPREGEQYQYRPITRLKNPKTAYLPPGKSKYPENHPHSHQYWKQRYNSNLLNSLGL